MRQRLIFILLISMGLAFNVYAQVPDTVSQKINAFNHAVDSSRLKITSKIDSLTNLHSVDSTVQKTIAGLQADIDSLQKINPLNDINKATQKLNSTQSKVNNKIRSIEGKLNGNLNKFNEQGGKLGQVNTPALDGKINTNLNLPSTDLKLPETKINTSIKVPDVKTPNIAGIDKINKIDKISNLSDADAEKEITSKLGDLDDVKEFEKETGPTAEMIKKWESDPDFAKEMALNKAKEQAVNHFEGHGNELKTAMNDLSKVRKKYKDAEGVIDLFKKPTNPMKGKPFIERVIPAINMQFQFSTNQWYDFNVAAGYRWSGRFTSGIGWMERVATNIKHRQFIQQDRAYGPRSYAEFEVKKSFHVRAEIEYINAFVTSPYLLAQGELPSRDWRWSGFAGIKKSFSFSEGLKGNVQMLYNVYDPHKRSPYTSRLAIRIGFEFPIKKKR